METPENLHQTIVATLTQDCTAADAESALGRAQQALEAAAEVAEVAEWEILSPLLTTAQAEQKRKTAADAQFAAERLQASVTALTERVEALRDAERAAAAEAKRASAIAERDALVADIRKHYPKIVRQLTELVHRIEISDGRCAAAGLSHDSCAEAIARNVPPTFYDGEPIVCLKSIKLPMPTGDGKAWRQGNLLAGTEWPGLKA